MRTNALSIHWNATADTSEGFDNYNGRKGLARGLHRFLSRQSMEGSRRSFLQDAGKILESILSSKVDLAAQFLNNFQGGAGPSQEYLDLRKKALTITGYCAGYARILFRMSGTDKPSHFPDEDWKNLQALQEYQVRQFVEEMVFGQVTSRGFSFDRWCASMPEAAWMQSECNICRAASAQSGAVHVTGKDRLRKWAETRAQAEGGERYAGLFTNSEDFQLLLAPALSMLNNMGACITPVERCRLWAVCVQSSVTCIVPKLARPMPGGGTDPGFAAADKPELIKYLITVSENEELVYHGLVARLFTPTDNLSNFDVVELGLPEGNPEFVLADVGDQYVYDSEHVSIDAIQELGWLLDTQMLVVQEQTCEDI